MRRMITLCFLTALLLVAGVLAKPANAQYAEWRNPYTGSRFNNPMSSVMESRAVFAMQRRMLYRGMLQKDGYPESRIEQIMKGTEEEIKGVALGKKGAATGTEPKTSAAKSPPAAEDATTTRFKPSGSRLLLTAFVNGLGSTAEQRKGLRLIFTEVFKAYEIEAAKVGLKNDVAAAMAFCIAAHYSACNDGADVSGAGAQAMIRQLRMALSSAEMRKAPNVDKQKIYETFVILGGFTIALSEAAKEGKDADLPKLQKQMGSDGIRSLLKVDPARVKITDNGLEIAPA